MVNKQRRLPPDYTIIQRRRGEEKRERLEEVTRANRRYNTVATWEHKTDAKLRYQKEVERQNEEKRQYEAKLNERRSQLRELLGREDRAYREEFRASFSTADDRRESIRRRAKALKDAREKQRREFADAMLVRRERMAQDAMRLMTSKLRTIAVAKDRESQLHYKVDAKRAQEAEEAKFAESWERNRQEKIKREEEERAAAEKRNKEMQDILAWQLDNQKQKEERRQKQIEAERAKFAEQWEWEEAEERERAARKLVAQREERVRIQQANVERASRYAEEKKAEEMLDAYLLKESLRKDAEARARELAEKKRVAEAQKAHQKHLEEQQKREAMDFSVLEARCREEQDKEWSKREAQWAKEAAVRQALMDDVNRTRQIQLAEKQKRMERERSADAEWAAFARSQQEEANAKERERLSKMRRARLRNQELLTKQIDHRRREKAIETQQEILLDKRALQFHKEFERKIQRMCEEAKERGVSAIADFRKKKVDLF